MTPQDLAKEIVDKYWKKTGFTDPNPYLLETDIATALTQYADERLDEAAQMVEKFPNYPVFKIKRMNARYMTKEKQLRIAKAIRSLKSSGGKA